MRETGGGSANAGLIYVSEPEPTLVLARRLMGAASHTPEETAHLREAIEIIEGRAHGLSRIARQLQKHSQALQREAEQLRQMTGELSQVMIRWEAEDHQAA